MLKTCDLEGYPGNGWIVKKCQQPRHQAVLTLSDVPVTEEEWDDFDVPIKVLRFGILPSIRWHSNFTGASRVEVFNVEGYKNDSNITVELASDGRLEKAVLWSPKFHEL